MSTDIQRTRMNVDTSQRSNAFDRKEQLFSDQLEDAVRKIGGQANESGQCSRGPIAILGKRGAGKSSLLKAIACTPSASNSSDQVVALDILEPNRIEKHEISLVSIVALILKKLENRRDPTSKTLEVLGEKLQELSQHFSVLVQGESLAKRDRTESAVSFANRALGDSRAGLYLPEVFSNFVVAACDVLKCKALLLLIDDTDVSHERCVEVLETLRKYVRTEKLIVVVAADEELLELQVARDNLRWVGELANIERDFGCASSTHDSPSERHREQAYLLREQYLSKVLPAHLRIHMPAVAELIQTGKLEVELFRTGHPSRLVLSSDQTPNPGEDGLLILCRFLGTNRRTAIQFLPSSSRSLALGAHCTILSRRAPAQKDRRNCLMPSTAFSGLPAMLWASDGACCPASGTATAISQLPSGSLAALQRCRGPSACRRWQTDTTMTVGSSQRSCKPGGLSAVSESGELTLCLAMD